MKIKLSIWNWIQLLIPQLIAIIFLSFAKSNSGNVLVLVIKILYHLIDLFLPNGDFTFFRCLAVSSIIMVICMLAPFASRQVKTGRSFKTKHATYEEYHTVDSKFQADSMNYFYIMLFHILISVFYYYTIDKTENKSDGNDKIQTEEFSNSSESEANNSTYSDESENHDLEKYNEDGQMVEESKSNINEASTISIGNQIWLNKNFDSESFSNGDIVPQAKSEKDWITFYESNSPCWCYLYFDENNKYLGKIYNWFAVFDERGLAPLGWKIPNQNDWNSLIENLGGINEAGSELIKTNGFNAKIYGNLEYQKHWKEISLSADRTNWWSSDKTSSFINNKGDEAIHYLTESRMLIKGTNHVYSDPTGEGDGGFIRLVKNY